MMANEYQYGKVEKLVVNQGALFDKNWFGFVKCKFRHKHRDNIPLHAVVKDGKLVFPYLETWHEAILSTEEIRYSLEHDIGYEYIFEFVYNYKEKGYIFKNIIDEIYDKKKKSKEALR